MRPLVHPPATPGGLEIYTRLRELLLKLERQFVVRLRVRQMCGRRALRLF